MPTGRERVLGCLLGGAIGDALGAPIEFDRLDDIRARFGDAGVTEFLPAYGLVGAITDDTQMTLFTAEGLLRAQATRERGDRADDVAAIRAAYLQWLRTQDASVRAEETGGGWLVDQDVLHHRRAPGTTCLSALYEGGPGTPVKPLNDSKGCGGVMRVAPIGLVTEHRFATAARAAALTHGHPSGYLSSGAFAHVVGDLLQGATLPDAIASARVELAQWPDHNETMRSIDAAVAVAAFGDVDAERLETLGGGWVGEEALAIGLCCALVAPDVRSGLELAVNHSGDSDSTGSIAGNLLGALHGVDALPAHLLGQLEGRALIETVADDLADVFVDQLPVDSTRYPPD
jgi:ADP-ribosyl-[dinitrogen reductase] hydrolase